MKVSHSMCGPHEDSDTISGPVKHFGWTQLILCSVCASPDCNNPFSVLLTCLHMNKSVVNKTYCVTAIFFKKQGTCQRVWVERNWMLSHSNLIYMFLRLYFMIVELSRKRCFPVFPALMFVGIIVSLVYCVTGQLFSFFIKCQSMS